LELNGTHKHLIYTDDVNIMGENANTTEKNKEALLQESREVGLDVNTEQLLTYLLPYLEDGCPPAT
jgi:hypothetical protein